MIKKTLILLAAISTLTITAFSLNSKGITIQQLAKSSHSWDGKSLPSYPQGQAEVTILKITIPPHKELPMHLHPVINAGVLLKGRLNVYKPNGQTLKLNAGDSLIELVNQEHFGKNPGNVPAEIIVFYAGTKNKPITLK